jgi:release factor glutamine methyltransferase
VGGGDAGVSADVTGGVVSRLRAAGCVFAEEEAALLLEAAASPDALEVLLARRVSGEPLEHVLGWASFAGLRLAVEPGVFVPRHRTELLVGEALAVCRGTRGRPVLLDLCCGAGAIGAAVASSLRSVELYAADVEPAAVRCARRNLEPFGAQVFEGDLFAPLPLSLRGRVDVLTANVPYVPGEAIALMPTDARDHEPRRALDGGSDGLDVLRRVAAEAVRWLVPGGTLLSECGVRQSRMATAVLSAAGLTATREEFPDDDTCVVRGVRPAR